MVDGNNELVDIMRTVQNLLELLSGCLLPAIFFVVLSLVAFLLDRLVRWMKRRDVPAAVCKLLHGVAFLLVAIDCAVVIAFSVIHALEVVPRLPKTAPSVHAETTKDSNL